MTSTAFCTGCGVSAQALVSTYQGRDGKPRRAVNPPEGWGVRAIGGQIAYYCGTCAKRLATGARVLDAQGRVVQKGGAS